jgi:transposase
MARTCELLLDLYGHAPSEALLQESQLGVYERVKPSLEAIQDQLLDSDVVHFDESGLRVESKLHWLHVASSAQLTYYGVHHKRGQEGMRDIGILPRYRGYAMHDHWRSYFTFDQCSHVLCNAHHLRELAFIRDEYHQSWADDMAKLLIEIKEEVESTDQSTDQCSLASDRQEEYWRRYDELLKQGYQANPPSQKATHKANRKRGRRKQTPPRNLLDRLHIHKEKVLAFMSDFRVPFDNNQAERDVRMIKLKQKISGGFRTLRGAQIFCAIRSYISTVRKQGHNVIDAIFNAINGTPFLPRFPDA